VLDYQDISSLFVLGDVKAKSILLSSSTVYFAGVTRFDEALIIMCGRGAVVDIKDTEGPVVYTDSDAAEVNASKEKVKLFIDHSYDDSFGDIRSVVAESYIKVEKEEGEVDYITIGGIYSAVVNDEVFLLE